MQGPAKATATTRDPVLARLRGLNIPLAVILVAALVLRLFNLGTPSLWLDEIQHAATSNLSFPDLFEYTSRYREGLMFYFFVIKAASLFGDSEWILRLPAALSGTLGVFFCYRLAGALAGQRAGNVAALLAAVNLMLIGHARQTVSYGLFFALDALSLWLFFQVFRSRFHKKSIALALVNAASILTYPAGFYTAVAEAGLLAVLAVSAWRRCALSRMVLFFLLTVFSMLPMLLKVMLFPAEDTNGNFVAFQTRWSEFPEELVKLLLAGAAPWNQIDIWAFVLAGLCCLGLWLLFKIERLTALSCLLLILLPGLGMYLTINSAFGFTHRAVYALPLVFSLAGAGLAWLIPGKRALGMLIPLTACVAAGHILTAHYTDIYGPEADRSVLFKLADYRRLALELKTLVRPGSPVIFSEFDIFRDLRWYMTDDPENPILTQIIAPGEGDLTVYFASNHGSFGHLSDSTRAEFVRSGRGQDAGIPLDCCNTLYSTVVHRSLPLLVEGEMFALNVTFDDLSYFRQVHSQRKVLFKPYFGGRLMPLESSDDCWFINKVRLAHQGPRMLSGNIVYDNTMPGNIIEVAVSSDGIDFQPVHLGQTVGLGITERFAVYLPNVREELYVRVKLLAKAWPPGRFLTNANTLRLARLQIFGCDSSVAPRCDYYNILSSAPVDVAPPRQDDVVPDELDNIVQLVSQELPGWTVFEPADPDRPARVRVRVNKCGDISVYPRVMGLDDGVQIIETGSRRQLLFLAGLGKEWTPLGMRYELPLGVLPEEGHLDLEITLTGKGQLWSRSGAVVFSARNQTGRVVAPGQDCRAILP